MIVDIEVPQPTIPFREVRVGTCFQYRKYVAIRLQYETTYGTIKVNATNLLDGHPLCLQEEDQVVPLDLKVVRNS